MARYFAFLRAINVGGHVVKMERLRALFEELPFTSVETFIASGNVIFHSPASVAGPLEAKIERHLKKTLGYEVETMIRTPAEAAEVLAYAEALVVEGETLHVGFLKSAVDATVVNERLAAIENAVDRFHVHGQELYWRCRGKFSDSLVRPNALAKAIGVASTARNVTSLRKLLAKYPA